MKKTFSLTALAAIGALALSACGGSGTDSGGTDPVGTWGEDSQGSPNLTLEEDSSLHGTDGCNRLTGSWSGDGDEVRFEQVASTLMACPDVDTWLSGLDTAKIDADSMRIFDESGDEIGQLTKTS